MIDRAEQAETQPATYERPTLIVIGNLKDLLAGSGSSFIDGGECNAANGEDTSC
jgi:hypothetical protein